MLQEIRKHSGNIVIKGILSLIGASFVAVGVIDVFRIMSEVPPVAKIGRLKVSFPDFYEAYRRALMEVRRRDPVLSKDQVEHFLPQKVLDELIIQQVLRREPDRQSLVIPDQVVVDQIHALCSVNGKYDPERFRQILGMMRMTPAQLMDNIRQSLKLQQLLGPVSRGMCFNAHYVDALVNTLGHRKNFEVAYIPWDRIPEQTPTHDDLAEWVAKNRERYELPDQRVVEVIVLDHKVLGDRFPVTEAEIRQEYEARRSEWTTPAEREIYRMAFTSEADAKDVKKIFGGKTMTRKDVAKAFPKIELTPVELQEMLKEDAEMVQELGGGEAVGPFLRGEKWVVYGVLKCVPEQVKPFEEVKQDVEREVRLQRVRTEIGSIKDAIEDALAEGKTVEEIAKEYPLSLVPIPNITEKDAAEKIGEALEGQIKDEAGREAIVNFATSQAFRLEKGEESSFEDVAAWSVVVRSVDLIPAHLPEMKDIEARVRTDWIQRRRQQSANEFAFALFGKVQTEAEWEKALKKSGLKAQHIAASRLDYERGTSDLNKTFSGNVVNQLLLSARHSVALVPTSDGQFAAVFVSQPESDVVSALDSEKVEQQERIRKMLNQRVSDEFSQLLVDSIQATYKIKKNQKSIEKVVKGSNNFSEDDA